MKKLTIAEIKSVVDKQAYTVAFRDAAGAAGMQYYDFIIASYEQSQIAHDDITENDETHELSKTDMVILQILELAGRNKEKFMPFEFHPEHWKKVDFILTCRKQWLGNNSVENKPKVMGLMYVTLRWLQELNRTHQLKTVG